MAISRLVRFVANDGQTHYGDADEDLRHARVLSTPDGPFASTASHTDITLPVTRLLCPLKREDARAVYCIGLNYRDHAEEAKMPIPSMPVVFHKPITALTGPFDDIVIPRVAWERKTVDYESELVIVIGKEAKRVPAERALDYVFGYCAGNDVSNRAWQLEPSLGGGQWCFSKSFDSSAPIGPAIVSTDLLQAADKLAIRGTLNSETMQDGNTNNFIFSVARVVEFLSQGMTLLPGTLIFTGTPAGVGFGRNPKVEMAENDVFRVEISGIGAIENKVVFEQ